STWRSTSTSGIPRWHSLRRTNSTCCVGASMAWNFATSGESEPTHSSTMIRVLDVMVQAEIESADPPQVVQGGGNPLQSAFGELIVPHARAGVFEQDARSGAAEIQFGHDLVCLAGHQDEVARVRASPRNEGGLDAARVEHARPEGDL